MKLLTELLINQTIESKNWTQKLIQDIAPEKWFITPEVIETNLAWQLGHLTLSQFYYTIVLLKGPQKDFAEKISLKKYSALFANGLKRKELLSEISVPELLENWKLVQGQTIEIFNHLKDEDLSKGVYKMPKPHPFVKTQQNSISWNIKHTMWHCGQMGMLKRIIDKPLEFGM